MQVCSRSGLGAVYQQQLYSGLARTDKRNVTQRQSVVSRDLDNMLFSHGTSNAVSINAARTINDRLCSSLFCVCAHFIDTSDP